MDISFGTVGVNIPVREDFGAVASVTGFFTAREDFFNFFKNTETKRKKNLIYTGVEMMFSKKAKLGATKWGGNLDSQR